MTAKARYLAALILVLAPWTPFARAQIGPSGGGNATSIQGQPVVSGATASGQCLVSGGTGPFSLNFGACASGGTTTININGTAAATQNPINFINSAATNGLTLTFTNPASTGNIQLGFTGTLSDTGLASSYSGTGSCPANEFVVTLARNSAPTCLSALTAFSSPANEFVTTVSAAGVFTAAQPSFANLSGNPTATQLAASPVMNDCIGYNGTALTWLACAGGSGAPGGSNGQLQFNNSGAFGGIPNWTWDGTNIALNGSGALNLTGLNNPAAPSLTVNGTAGTTTISYEVVVMEGSSTTAASPAATTTTASATLGGSNTITVTTASITNSTSCKVYRTATNGTSPTTTGLIGTVSCGLAVTDNGLPGDGTTPSAVNNTGTITARNFVASGPGSGFTQWTTSSLSPSASGTVLCGANVGNVFACSDNGGPLANVAVAGNDLQVYSGNVMSVAGFMLTSPGNIGTQALTLQFNNDTTTGTVNDLLAKLGGVGPSPSAIKIATTDTDIPVYPVTSLTATSGAAILAVAGEAACTFDNATTYADYVVASTTTAADCHDAGASLPAGPVYVVGTIAQAGGAAGNYLVKGPGFFIAAVPASSPAIINGYCGGAATASSFTYPFGMGGINAACSSNDTVVNTGFVMPYAGTIVAMYVHAGISATTADVASVQINGSYPSPSVQCTITASGNACSVTGASAAFNAGDYIGVKIGTGASDTLGDISVSLEIQ